MKRIIIATLATCLLFSACGGAGGTEPVNSSNSDTNTSNSDDNNSLSELVISEESFISAIKEALKNDGNTADESIIDIKMNDRELVITMDISRQSSGLNPDSQAFIKTSAITDTILALPIDYDSLWDSIKVDFKDIGSYTNSKSDIYGTWPNRIFDFTADKLVK